MNCLNDEVIQLYIDGELGRDYLTQLESHLKICKKCDQRISEQRDFSQRIMVAIKKLDFDLDGIPNLEPSKKKNGLLNKAVYKILYPLAAAIIITFFLVLPISKDGENPKELIALSSFSGEVDANLPLSEQEIEIVFYNEKGEIWIE